MEFNFTKLSYKIIIIIFLFKLGKYSFFNIAIKKLRMNIHSINTSMR